eukprot:TRINITY_DN1900_c0_g1_i3.p3 TRINITY_DN1900_c0_g1~~TRINITY_DN1900_c0_g1_i3.p3  ORF type:complete len:118 (+),score=30.22 TRINITY_DN1900_c0_g1_i3:23-376(+)
MPLTSTFSQVVANISAAFGVAPNETAMQEALYVHGPLSVSVSSKKLQHYISGTIECGLCGQTLDHAVVLVGWGADSRGPYWSLKNSWGADWGEQGYFRLRLGCNCCGVAAAAMFPVV